MPERNRAQLYRLRKYRKDDNPLPENWLDYYFATHKLIKKFYSTTCKMHWREKWLDEKKKSPEQLAQAEKEFTELFNKSVDLLEELNMIDQKYGYPYGDKHKKLLEKIVAEGA